VFQPQSLLPEQFFGGCRRQNASRTGEYRLLVAVLEEAIRCFQQNACATTYRQRRLFAEAEQWIMARGDAAVAGTAAPAFSFEYICAVLGLDPAWLREGLRRRRQRAGGFSPTYRARS